MQFVISVVGCLAAVLLWYLGPRELFLLGFTKGNMENIPEICSAVWAVMPFFSYMIRGRKSVKLTEESDEDFTKRKAEIELKQSQDKVTVTIMCSILACLIYLVQMFLA